MHKIFTLIFLLTFLMACGNKAPKTDSTVQQSKALPPVPEAFLVEMFNKIDHIDYYFRQTNFSVSQDTKDAVQSFLSLMSPGLAMNVSDSCVSPLRMTYLAKGNIEFETEMYMTENCTYVEYYIDNVKTYQSSYTQEGFNYLMNIIESAKNGQR